MNVAFHRNLQNFIFYDSYCFLRVYAAILRRENSLVSSPHKPFPIPIFLCLIWMLLCDHTGLEGSKPYMEPGELQRSKGCPDPTQPHLEARHSSLQQVIRLIAMNTCHENMFPYIRSKHLSSGIMKLDVDMK